MKLIIGANLMPVILEPLNRLEQEGRLRLVRLDNEGTPTDEIHDADALYRWHWNGQQVDRILEAAPNVRWIHTPMAGVDNLLTPLVRARDIILTNSAGVHAEQIAEWVILAMLSIVKRLPIFLDAYRESTWWRPDDWSRFMLGELTNKTVLILGAGSIGSAIARRAVPFSMHVWGSRRSRKPVEHFERMYGDDDWRQALPEADFVVVALPLTQETRACISSNELTAMKRNAWLINIARGAIVDEPALIEALHARTIGGAWLDATTIEPLPPESPLWKTSNTLITPHITWTSEYTMKRVTDLLLKNIERFLNGESLINVVDKQAGY